MATISFISGMLKKIKVNELSRELKHYKAHEKLVNASEKLKVDYKVATQEERDKIRNSVERERKKELAHTIYTLILSILITMILFYTIEIVF